MEENRIRQLLELLQTRSIKPSGNNITSSCPFEKFHKDGKDSKPSFAIQVNASGDSAWNCFGCGRKGKTIKTLLGLLHKDCGIRVPGFDVEVKLENEEFSPRKHTKFSYTNLTSDSRIFSISDYKKCFQEIPQYVLDRGLTQEQIKKFRIGYNSVSLRMFIPIFDQRDQMVGYSERTLGYDADKKVKYKFSFGFKKVNFLYGEWTWDLTDDVLFLSEGYFDVYALDRVMKCNAAGFFGTGVGDKQLLRVKRNFKKVVICPHNDKLAEGRRAGVSIATDWVHMLEHLGVVVEIMPVINGYSDVGDWPDSLLRRVLEKMGYGDRLR